MKEYRKVIQFDYKNNTYNMYLDNKNKRFFLKVDKEGNLSYLTIEELVDIVSNVLFAPISLSSNIEKNDSNKKIKIVPKVLVKGVAVTLSFVALTTAFEVHQSLKRSEEIINNSQSHQKIEQSISEYLSYSNEELADGSEELVVDTYLESDWLNYLFIYDMNYLDKALDYENVSIDQVKKEIKENDKISTEFKNLMYEYCDSLIKKYPDIELRVLYENLKTLEINELDSEELFFKTLSQDSVGCYVRSENKIYVLEGYEYKKGTWDYQVIFHELSHCLRTGSWKMGDTKVEVQIEGQNFYNTITAEALNSLFTVSLFDYEERDIAYQLQSNYHSIMIECMDNYSLEDYVNHSVSYYAKKLDEFNNDDNYATTILDLIDFQYRDYHNDSINIYKEEYYPIYDYVSEMYYKKNINSTMSYSEAKMVADKLIERVMFDVPEEYNIDINHFYDYLNDYCEMIGINTKTIVK